MHTVLSVAQIQETVQKVGAQQFGKKPLEELGLPIATHSAVMMNN